MMGDSHFFGIGLLDDQMERQRSEISEKASTNLENWIEIARNGDSKALNHLLQQLQGYLAVILRSTFKQQYQAKVGQSDVMQQTMLKASQNIENFRGQTTEEFQAWGKQILLNELKLVERHYSTNKRSIHQEVQIHASESSNGRSAVQNEIFVDQHPTPRTQLAIEERASEIRSAIDRLPLDHQIVLRLRNDEKLSYRQIAMEMDKSETAVTKLWFRALLSLQKELSDSKVDLSQF